MIGKKDIIKNIIIELTINDNFFPDDELSISTFPKPKYLMRS